MFTPAHCGYFKFGPLTIKVEGRAEFVELFRHETREISADDQTADIDAFIYLNKESIDFRPIFLCGKNTIDFSHDGFRDRSSPHYDVVATGLFTREPMQIFFNEKRASFERHCFRRLRQLFNVSSASGDMRLNDFVNYSTTWLFLAIALLKKQSAFLHAGIMTKEESGIVISGTGGCGKTSAVIELARRGYDYLAEDFAIVGAEGVVYPSNKSVSLYQSDIKYSNKNIEAVDFIDSGFQKLKYRILTKALKKNVKIKVSPTSLFSVSKKKVLLNKLSVFYVVRGNSTQFKRESMSLEDFVKRSSQAVMKELNYLSVLFKLNSANDLFSTKFISEGEFLKRLQANIKSAFVDSNIQQVVVPSQCSPSELVDYLLNCSSNEK